MKFCSVVSYNEIIAEIEFYVIRKLSYCALKTKTLQMVSYVTWRDPICIVPIVFRECIVTCEWYYL